ncbi:MAG: hypothetical protein AABY04_02420, partial [Candidatus Micrarchaeota archaeon]
LGNPQSLNRYAYVQNNPLFFIDPTGNKAVMKKPVSATSEKLTMDAIAHFGMKKDSLTFSTEVLDATNGNAREGDEPYGSTEFSLTATVHYGENGEKTEISGEYAFPHELDAFTATYADSNLVRVDTNLVTNIGLQPQHYANLASLPENIRTFSDALKLAEYMLAGLAIYHELAHASEGKMNFANDKTSIAKRNFVSEVSARMAEIYFLDKVYIPMLNNLLWKGKISQEKYDSAMENAKNQRRNLDRILADQLRRIENLNTDRQEQE